MKATMGDVEVMSSFPSEASNRMVGMRSNAASRPVVPELHELGRGTWALSFLATVLPPFLTLIATSDLTPVGTRVWISIHKVALRFREGLNAPRAPGGSAGGGEGEATETLFLWEGYHMFLAVFALLLFVSWLLDVAHWKHGGLKWGYGATCAANFVAAVVLYAEVAPSLLVIAGLFFSVCVVVGVRWTLIKDSITPDQFNFIVSAFYFLDSFIFLSIWLYMRAFHFHDSSSVCSEHSGDILKDKKVTCFIIGEGPVIQSILYLILGLFIFKRGQFHVPDTGDVHVLSDLDGLEHTDNVYVGQELQFVFYCFCVVGMGAWVAASVSAQDSELSNAVARTSGAFFLMICIYLWCHIGHDRIIAAVSEHPSVQWAMELVLSDWMKAIFLSMFWPVVPLFFLIEFVHERMRSCLGRMGIEPWAGAQSGGWLTAEASERWEELARWDWPGVLSKSISFGLFYFAVMVGGTRGSTIFLAWLAELVESWEMFHLLAMLFVVGLTMFLIPVVPGLPIYLVSGIVVVRKFGEGHFYTAVAVASALSWVIKLASNVVLMKCVGEPLGKNVRVRMLVQTYTPTMKAVEEILIQPGITLPKVAVLVGGPDWPTAVLCAMLNVPVCSMLVGTSPVLVLIVPVVMAAAYKLSAETSDLAIVLVMVSAVVQMGAFLIAGIYVRTVKVARAAEFEEVRAEDEEVLEAVLQEEALLKEWTHKTRWGLMPCIVKAALVMGSWYVVGMLSIYNFASEKALVKFELTDKISDLPGGNPANVFKHPLGVLTLYFLGAQIVCKLVYDCWCSAAAKVQPRLNLRVKSS